MLAVAVFWGIHHLHVWRCLRRMALPVHWALLKPVWPSLQAKTLEAQSSRKQHWRGCWTCAGAQASCTLSSSPVTADWSEGTFGAAAAARCCGLPLLHIFLCLKAAAGRQLLT
jgi:hypothetical protein